MKALPIVVALTTLSLPAAAGAAERITVHRATTPVVELQAGGGVMDFVKGLDAATDTGAGWDLRAIVLPHSPIGLEAAYFGSLSTLTADNSRSLMESGGEALARVNLIPTGMVHPYVAAGAGVDYLWTTDMSMSGGSGGSSGTGGGGGGYALPASVTGYQSSTDFEIPAAVGVDAELARSRVTIGARGGYRYLFHDQTLQGVKAADAQAWNATARLGVIF